MLRGKIDASSGKLTGKKSESIVDTTLLSAIVELSGTAEDNQKIAFYVKKMIRNGNVSKNALT